MVRTTAEKGSSFTTGYLILSVLVTMSLALFFKDATYLVFALPTILAFTLAASIDKRGGSADSDLEAVGWSSKNLTSAIPLGIAGGIISLVMGGFIMRTASMASLVPDFSTSIAALTGASIIPAGLALATNIIATAMVVVPSEELGYRLLAPYAFFAAFKNQILAWIAASLLWAGTHIPTFMAQGVDNSMYIVLMFISLVNILLIYYTQNIMSAIISHMTFNIGVLLSPGGNIMAYYVVAVIAIILSLAYFTSNNKRGVRV